MLADFEADRFARVQALADLAVYKALDDLIAMLHRDNDIMAEHHDRAHFAGEFALGALRYRHILRTDGDRLTRAR